MSRPSKMIRPSVGSISLMIVRPSVVLPQPDSPTMPSVSPFRTERSTPETASTCPTVCLKIPALIGKCFGKGGKALFYDDVRRVATGTYNSSTPAWVHLSQNAAKGDGGSCYSDSGGPNFLGTGSTIASITITGDRYCRAFGVDVPARHRVGQSVPRRLRDAAVAATARTDPRRSVISGRRAAASGAAPRCRPGRATTAASSRPLRAVPTHRRSCTHRPG